MTRHRRKSGRGAASVLKPAKTSMESAGYGHCTRAFEALSTAQIRYGALQKPTSETREALGTARQTFFRKCVVPQR